MDPPTSADERAQLTAFLDFQRATIVWKSTGLTDEQARRVLVPSDLTTIAGLLAHLWLVEWYWFGVVLDGWEDTWQEILDQDRDAEFREGMRTPLPELIARYEAQCRRSREIVAALPLDHEVQLRGGRYNVRWVLIHMIEETARHAGHFDLLREMLDGSTGE